MVIIMCPVCGRTYSSETFFQYHFAVEHTSQSLPCGRCPKSFPDKVTRSSHLSAHDRNQHSCNLCAKVCKSLVLLYIHVTVCHHYHGTPTCHVCKVELSKRHLGNHYATIHADIFKSLEQRAEFFCSVHSPRPFPEQDWALACMLTRRLEAHHSYLPNGGLSRNNEATLEDRATGSSSEEIEYVEDDARFQHFPIRYLDEPNPEYESNQMNINSSSSHYFGLDQLYENQSANDLSGGVEINLLELNEHELARVFKQAGLNPNAKRSRTLSELDKQNTQPSSTPKISKAVDIYEVVHTLDGQQKKLKCVLCGLKYEDLDSLLADHRVIDYKNIFSD